MNDFGMNQNLRTFIIVMLLAIAICAVGDLQAQPFRSSVVATDFDFITEDDPDTFLCLEYKGHGTREMPDKTRDRNLYQLAYIFVAYFNDGTSVDIAVDEAFENEVDSQIEAMRYTSRLGKLPTSLRVGVERLVVHKGTTNATAFSDRGLIVVYSDNASNRISTHDLEETIFHESVHASWDERHAHSKAWRAAQESDGEFVTHYAKSKPDGEDLAESALFAYTLVHHPERIPKEVASEIRALIPHRIDFVRKLLPADRPIHYSVGPQYACDGSGKTFVVTAPTNNSDNQADENSNQQDIVCNIDLTSAGGLSDVLSNALMRGLEIEEQEVRAFLTGAENDYANANELIDATEVHFGIDRVTLEEQIKIYHHCNCSHDEIAEDVSPRNKIKPVVTRPVDTHQHPTMHQSDSTRDSSFPLYLIATLLGLLLIVNAATLMVLLRKSHN